VVIEMVTMTEVPRWQRWHQKFCVTNDEFDSFDRTEVSNARKDTLNARRHVILSLVIGLVGTQRSRLQN
jgi:hypothetical protein